MNKIANNIKDQRNKHHMSQEDLAGKLYVTRQTISNYENAHQITLISWIGYLLLVLPYVIGQIVSSIDRYLWELVNPHGGTYSFSFGFGEFLDRIHFSIYMTLNQFKIVYAAFFLVGVLWMLTSTGSRQAASNKKQIT